MTHVELHHDDTVSRVRFQSGTGIQLLSATARRELGEALAELESRPECRVAVFEAEGRTFIAGADIKELQSLDAPSAEAVSRETHALFDRIETLPAVTMAAVHAACAGGGFELALSCDLRFAAAGARIGLPEVTLGLIPGWGGSVRMLRLFGPAVARKVILSGELLPAEEALHLGLVSGVAPDDAFREFVQQQVESISQRSPHAVRTVKSLLRELAGVDRAAQFAAEARRFGECYNVPDSREGIAAFLEKRAAEWSPPGFGDARPG
ncbi:MAG: enoyl-CoA hydratase/isomerase family protein [Planctomycetaceae bacterium]